MVSRKKKSSIKQPESAREQILNKPPRSARQVVLRVLEHCHNSGDFFSEPLENFSLKADLSPVDRRLAREIVAGVVRRQATLAALISPHIRRPRENIEETLWLLLKMGVYELAFLEGIPPHASVNETTELARYLRRERWTGFLNGTLRSVSRGLLTELTDSPAADAFPVSRGRYRKCAEAWFPNPKADPIGYFSEAFSFPRWLVERWQQQFTQTPQVPLLAEGAGVRGNRDDKLLLPAAWQDLGFWFNSPPVLILRVNRLRVSRGSLLENFAKNDIPAEPGELPEAIVLKQSRNIPDLPGFAEGYFSVQDLTAMKAVDLLNPQPGETVWDMCAAPGTKTAAIAERMQNEGRLLATDIQPARLSRIEDNRQRLGLDIIETRTISASGNDLPAGPFDAVLVDAPCSNTGVLGKRPEARWRLNPADIEELAELQLRLLQSACERVKPGGRVVYSTCSIEPEENQEVVNSLLRHRSDWELTAQQIFWPGQPADGGFAAILQRV